MGKAIKSQEGAFPGKFEHVQRLGAYQVEPGEIGIGNPTSIVSLKQGKSHKKHYATQQKL